MNSIPDIIREYRPVSFLSVDIDRLALKSAFKLSSSEAVILSTLLREYQVGNFPVKAVRQHIHNLRKKLADRYGTDTISSVGLGFYAIPETIKAVIQSDFRRG